MKQCVFSMNSFIWPVYFSQMDAKEKDIYRHEIICTASTKHGLDELTVRFTSVSSQHGAQSTL